MSNKKIAMKYRRIGEVSKITGVPQALLRNWEREFPMLKPIKKGGYRYYSEKDIELILKIKDLLINKGFTHEGARKKLEEKIPKEAQGFLKILEGIKRELKEIEELLNEDIERD